MTSPGQDRPATRLPGIEALRGLAASAVVLCHAARHVDKAWGAPGLILAFQAGHAGVDLFFVISGFIILFVHGPDIGQPARLAHYLGRRASRVLPLYWIALGLTIAMGLAGGHAAPGPLALLWSAFLLPSSGEPILGIAWTLQFEMLFYALFALLILDRRAGTGMFAVWLAAVVASACALRPAWLAPSLCGAYGLEFFFGMAAAHAVRHWRMPAPRLLACTGAACFVAGLVFESTGRLDGYGLAGRLVYGLAAMLLVSGMAASDRAGTLALPRWLSRLGGASYSIYLFQFVFIGLAWRVWIQAGLARSEDRLVLFATLAGVALAGGFAASRFVERPLLRLMRRKAGGFAKDRVIGPGFPSQASC